MKTIFKYKSGYIIKQMKNGSHSLFRGRICEAHRMDTRKEASDMYRYLTSK
jgi:hypothetical protein